jgi:hypothetical protein
MREKPEMLNITPGCAQRILGIDMPQHLDLARDVVELLGHVLANLRLGTAATARALLLRYVMEHVATRQMITEGTPTVPLAVLRGCGLTRIAGGRFREKARRGRRVEQVTLPGSLGQPLPPRPEEQPLQGQVLFLQAGVGALKLLGRRASLVELMLQVVEALEQGGVLLQDRAELRLAGRQVVGDGR